MKRVIIFMQLPFKPSMQINDTIYSIYLKPKRER